MAYLDSALAYIMSVLIPLGLNEKRQFGDATLEQTRVSHENKYEEFSLWLVI